MSRDDAARYRQQLEDYESAFVSWRQDSTYWGLDLNDVVSAWIALSDAPIDSGAMKMHSRLKPLLRIPCRS